MISKLDTLLRYPGSPPFIYVHHPHHPASLLSLPESTSSLVTLDVIEYCTPRLLYSGILHKLGSELGEIPSWDLFVRGLRSLVSGRTQKATPGKGKRKAAVMENGDDHIEGSNGLVVVLTHAERLRTVLGSGWSVITRLSELVCLSKVQVVLTIRAD